jgi:PBSX family phage portal protein
MDNVTHLPVPAKEGPTVLSIGDLDSVLDHPIADLFDNYFLWNGAWYEPPVNFDTLTKLLRVNAHHESAIACKKTTVMYGYKPGPVKVISRQALGAATTDYVYLGNAFFQQARTRAGRTVELRHLTARTMRRMKEANRYMQIVGGQQVAFEPGEIIHLKQYAPESNVYGLPEYLGAVNSLLLNEDANLFRRRFYQNGGHLGYILFTKGSDIDGDDLKHVGEEVKKSKGTGNFKSMLIHLGIGDADAKVLHVGDFAKDDWEKIKTISRDDIISAHRVPPQILAVLTDNKLPITGDLDKIVRLYNNNVVRPLQLDIAEGLNEHLDKDQQISFDPYLLTEDGAPDGAGQGGTDALPKVP